MTRTQLLIRTHNEADTLEDLFQSIFDSEGDIDAIILNDGSTDKTAEIIDRALPLLEARTDGKFTYINMTESLGLPDSMEYLNLYYENHPQSDRVVTLSGKDLYK